jgi:hypothetical protein
MKISNGCPGDVTNINLQFHPAEDPGFDSLGAPIQLVIPTLKAGKTITVDLHGVFGISKITATATCTSQMQQLSITAPMGDYDGDGNQEYAAFCPVSPTGTIYQPTLEFVIQSGAQMGKLHGKWRWDTNWAPNAVMDSKPCP